MRTETKPNIQKAHRVMEKFGLVLSKVVERGKLTELM